ncbi:MAG: PaaX domain protein [Candidatus Gottesmanbacteria bacterium GW2011_GWA2_41_12]|uniref:PaaX domain protein n=2 Tax=Candidatus Gottesmaniibacteriota TaxID=1752720 RepID=A0A0G0WVN6_9BACT|nr:MAG: PaaX domain protein [Candidatus Gottesmanbacteria bacterium GW2011_GWC2_39_8]KKR88490.1 MAG: PaaX domain protein [Candidatus Gottesmanbacteria bacterium GW2011_GWA2_41_12]
MTNKNFGKTRTKTPYVEINWEKAKTLFQIPAKEEQKRNFPTKEILRILATAGAIGLTFAMPKSGASIASQIMGDNFDSWYSDRIFGRLKKQKYVSIINNSDNSVTVRITKNGMSRALTYQLDEMSLSKRKWDKKWRVIIFDIPEKYRRVRDIFRMRLKQLDLYPLQESVFVSPYPCFDQIEFLRELYGISFTVNYLLVEKIEDDKFLKDYFKLN